MRKLHRITLLEVPQQVVIVQISNMNDQKSHSSEALYKSRNFTYCTIFTYTSWTLGSSSKAVIIFSTSCASLSPKDTAVSGFAS